MTWTKLDDGFWRDPKMNGLSVHARMLYIAALNWSCDQLTDGFIPRSESRRIMAEAKPRHIGELIDAALWNESDTENGYNIARFLDYQPSKADVERKREQWRNRKAKSRNDSPTNQMSRRDTPQESPMESRLESPRPDPTRPETDNTITTKRADTHTDDDDDDPTPDVIDYWLEQWANYTRRQLTDANIRSWTNRIKHHITTHGPPTHELLKRSAEAGIVNPAGWEHHIPKQPTRHTNNQPPDTCPHIWTPGTTIDPRPYCPRCKTFDE